MTFDVSQYELEDAALLEVQNAAGTDDLLGEGGKPVTILVYSPGSKQGVRAINIGSRNAALRMAGAIRGKVSKNAVDEAEQEEIEKWVMVTAAINNFPIDGGALALYSNPKLRYIRDQVEAFFNNKGNFSPPSQTNLASTSDASPG